MAHYNVQSDNPNWEDGLSIVNGYVHVLSPDHHRANYNGYVRQHILIAERALGKPLPKDAVGHHINGKKAENDNTNLVLCENNNYHKLLHKRERAKKACGHANYEKCCYCHKYDDPKSMSIFYRKQNKFIHKSCNTERCRIYRKKGGGYHSSS